MKYQLKVPTNRTTSSVKHFGATNSLSNTSN